MLVRNVSNAQHTINEHSYSTNVVLGVQTQQRSEKLEKMIEAVEMNAANEFQAAGMRELGELELAFVGGGIAELVGA